MGIDSRQQVRGQWALLLLDASPTLALGLQPPSSGSISTPAVSPKPGLRASAMLLCSQSCLQLLLGRDPPLNRSPALTEDELITAYSSPCPPPLLPFPQHTWPHPTLLGNAPPTTETKFGLKKKKRRRRRRKLSQAYLYTVCSCAPSFIYKRKLGKSLQEEKKNSSSQWVEPMKTYLLPELLEACPRASLGVCVFRK